MSAHAGSRTTRVLEALTAEPLTGPEIALKLNLPLSAISPALSQLAHECKIFRFGKRRGPESLRSAIVWAIAKTPFRRVESAPATKPARSNARHRGFRWPSEGEA